MNPPPVLLPLSVASCPIDSSTRTFRQSLIFLRLACSPDEAERNPGILDSVLLHPGYNIFSFIAPKRFFNGARVF
jgi:hypothetical protein